MGIFTEALEEARQQEREAITEYLRLAKVEWEAELIVARLADEIAAGKHLPPAPASLVKSWPEITAPLAGKKMAEAATFIKCPRCGCQEFFQDVQDGRNVRCCRCGSQPD